NTPYEWQNCKHQIGSSCPQCDSNGNFVPKQCSGSTGYCWCVNIFTGEEIPDTRTPPGTKLKCGE
uniref:Thyroglobulin type-1 domain-containing protein n=1 Tax=Anabas testudineus TaxID=64144 RepID=A0A3Q1IFG4_ANATE